MIATQEKLVNDAFSRQSPIFDDIYENNDITLWMRNRTRSEVLKYIKKGDRMLELNAGTGIDACFFNSKGIDVLATDNADGMLDKIQKKINERGLKNIAVQKCSFNNLEILKDKKFNYVFSNFAGLNCTENLGKVLDDISDLLLPGGYFSLVIMPKFCPWEVVMALKGNFKTAFRRFDKGGTMAHLEGVYFKCYYYNPSYVLQHMKRHDFELCSLKGLSIVMPPPFIEDFKVKHPRLFNLLEKVENKLWNVRPFKAWCDQYVITMRKK